MLSALDERIKSHYIYQIPIIDTLGPEERPTLVESYSNLKLNPIGPRVGVDSTTFWEFAKFRLISVIRDCLTCNVCPSRSFKKNKAS